MLAILAGLFVRQFASADEDRGPEKGPHRRALRSLEFGSAAWGNVAEDEYLTVYVKVYGPGLFEQVREHVGVLVSRADNVLLRSIVEDQLESKAPGISTLFLGP